MKMSQKQKISNHHAADAIFFAMPLGVSPPRRLCLTNMQKFAILKISRSNNL